LTGPEAIAFALADNQTAILAEWDLDTLGPILKSLQDINIDLSSIGFDSDDLAGLMPDQASGVGDGNKVTLSDTFGVPPFSVLDARQGYWQDRKRMWLSLGIQSELGRGGGKTWNVNTDGTAVVR
jgi:hypothetical protein